MMNKTPQIISLAAWLVFAPAFAAAAAPAIAPPASVPARAATESRGITAEGVVEAIRQTVLAAQVSGAIVELNVKVGDLVTAGQVLAKIDARAAGQTAAAAQAQVQAARAALDVAAKDFNRQKQLFQQGFISQAALDQADAIFRAARAQVDAQIAQAGANQTLADFFTLRAPYAGVVSEVPVVQGDMALPGRPIVTVYDPTALRVSANLPSSASIVATMAAQTRIELAGAAQPAITPTRLTVLPTVDANTHTMQIRLDLPAGVRAAAPGMFARVFLPGLVGESSGRVSVPLSAIVRRVEMTGVYVLDGAGNASLRLVRLGRVSNGTVEVLSGVSAGERVATDPQAALKARK